MNNSHIFGVDWYTFDNNDMRAQKVYEGCRSKTQQLLLATQVAKMIMKIDDIITPVEY